MSDSFIFIDDSGFKDWKNPYDLEKINNPPPAGEKVFWRNNYFVLAALHLDRAAIKELDQRINAIKQEYFGTYHVELKSDWLRNPFKQKKHYLSKINIREEQLRNAVESIYQIFSDNIGKIVIQAVILDKRYYKDRSSPHRQPLALAASALLDRIEKYQKGATIIFDQMDSEIKADRGEQNTILNVAYHRAYLGQRFEKYSHSKIEFKKSNQENFLQLADLVTYNVFRQFVDHGREWEKGMGSLPLYPFFERIQKNFLERGGVINNYGLIKLPDPAKVKWKT